MCQLSIYNGEKGPITSYNYHYIYILQYKYLKALRVLTLEYLITVQHLLNLHNGKLHFIWLAKKDNLMLLN